MKTLLSVKSVVQQSKALKVDGWYRINYYNKEKEPLALPK